MMNDKLINLGLPPGIFLYVNTKLREWKVVIGLGENNEHITIRYWSDKRTFDIHKTIENPSKQHFKMCELRQFTLFRILVQIRNYQIYLYKKYWVVDTINIGKLKKNNCLLTPINGSSIDPNEIIKITKRNRKIKFKNEVCESIVSKLFLSPNEIYINDSIAFEVYSHKRNSLRYVGLILKRKENNSSFYFLSKKKKNEYKRELYLLFFNLLKKSEFENKEEVISALFDRLSERFGLSI